MRVYSCFISLSYLVITLSFLEAISAGSITEGGPCSPSNDRVDSSTHKFNSDCDDKSFCSPSPSQTQSKRDVNSTSSATSPTTTGTCTKRLCRKDEFPFGFVPGEVLPPFCTHGYFCPDNGAGCEAVLPVGSPCDMDRDYQCAGPKNWNLTASEWNFNGSVCLQSTCTFANATIGLPCILERTTYAGYNHDNAAYNITVMRDNCLSTWPKLYCGATTSICQKMKDLGFPCGNDRECYSQCCNFRENVCSEPPGLPAKVMPWQYALTIVSVLAAVTAICTFLVLSHKRQRMERYYELLEYYHEQTSLRASIISLHTAAAQRLSREKIHSL